MTSKDVPTKTISAAVTSRLETSIADTIAAVATAPGTGAIAIVRFSGSAAFSILSELFHSEQGVPKHFEGHKAYHGFLVDSTANDSTPIDEVVVVTYRAPHSYTGEDLVEINCHGGQVVSRYVLELILRHGARLARPGEFTQRAYLSGRLDLTQAEAVLDVIQAKTRRQGKLAVSALSGHIGKQVGKIRASLIDLLTRITAGIDFPDEIGDAPVEEITSVLQDALAKLRALSQTASSGRFLREGLRLAIVGRPNAGKSSLLNQLLKFERAIVTDTPGTTRDSIEEQVDINGIPVTLIDTAGIRATEDNVERIGIERSHQAVEAADLVVLIVDLLEGWGQPETHIQELIGARAFLPVYNKIDICKDRNTVDAVVNAVQQTQGYMQQLNRVAKSKVQKLFISAKTGEGIDELSAAIEQWALGGQELLDHGGSLNERQAQLCIKAIDALDCAIKTADSQLPQDCIASDLKIAVDNLSEVSGEIVSEEVISQVFANFCIGK